MPEYKLIFFSGCPNHQPAVDLLNEADLDFESVCQDKLDDSNPLKNFSSPTLLKDNKIIFGSEANGGGCSMMLPSKCELLKLI